MRNMILTMASATVLLVPSARAQSYSVDWFKVSGGGGMSTAGIYSVSGSIGQPDAGTQMSAGNFSLTGGFWTLFAVQTPGAPLLSIKLTSTNTVMVFWPSSSSDFVPQQNSGLNPAGWIAPSATITDDGTNKFIIVNPPGGNRYYRLYKP